MTNKLWRVLHELIKINDAVFNIYQLYNFNSFFKPV